MFYLKQHHYCRFQKKKIICSGKARVRQSVSKWRSDTMYHTPAALNHVVLPLFLQFAITTKKRQTQTRDSSRFQNSEHPTCVILLNTRLYVKSCIQ